MSEFDFEEIDKAVSGALQPPTPGVSTDPANPSVRVFGPPAPTPAATAPVTAPTPNPTPVVLPVPAPSPASPAVDRSADTPASRRAGGRFMDMVHPSSDMRTSTPQAPSPSVAPSPVVPEPTPAVAAPVPAMSSVEEVSTPNPLESPFLPDAKVEKRPLGGELPTQPITPSPAVSPATYPDPMDFPSNHTEISPEDTAALEKIETESVEKEQLAEENVPPVVEQTSPTPLSTEEPVTVASSINQQYKEQPPAEQQSGAVFDTEAYHQPLPAPAKKRSGAWVILWILLLVILGAGIGAAIYFFVLPLL